MIKLERVRFQTSKPFFSSLSQKGLRISIENIVRNSKAPGRAINQTCMEWEQNFYIPVLFQQQLEFEIYNIHSFGYNPEELSIIYTGKIIIDNSEQNHSAWEVYDPSKKRLGFLSASIRIIRSVRPQQTQNKVPIIFDTDPKLIFIKSIVVHLPAAKDKIVYAAVTLDQKTLKTKTRKSQTGQLVYLEQLTLYKDPASYEAKICLYELGSENKKTLLASGKMTLVGDKPDKKIILTDNYERLGELYIEAEIIKMGNHNEGRYGSFFMNQKKLKVKSQSKQKQKLKKLNERKDQIFSSSMFLEVPETPKSSRSKKSSVGFPQSSRYKKVSVVHKNTDVVFNKEKRFGVEDKKYSEQVSYLRNRSFEFKTPRSKFYRGAAMGFGGKTDFARQNKDKPGVGSYNLPSVFDRY